MHCTITNLSPLPRRRWCPVTVPREKGDALPVECSFAVGDGRLFRAVKGRSVGSKTVFRVLTEMIGSEVIDGQIIGRQAPKGGGEAYAIHPWVYDDPLEMVPQVGVQTSSAGEPVWSEHVDLQVIDQSPAHARFLITQRLPQFGLIHHCWVDVCHNDPVAQFWSRLTWSDRNDPNNARVFDRLVFRAGEYTAFDFAYRHGIQTPIQQGRNWVTRLNSAPVPLVDGGALPITGRLLAHWSNPDELPPPPDDLSFDVNRWTQDIVAGFYGDVYGICHEWDGAWLAARNVGRFGDAEPRAIADFQWQQHVSLQDQPAGWYADRPLGLTRFPGATGAQPDFGATKGSAILTACDPRLIYALMYSAHGDLLRGYLHHEADGRLVTAAAHPSWVTWSRRTHYHAGVSTDRLGKSPTAVMPSGLYEGIDDEHMSHNYLAAYATLTDDPMVATSLLALLENDRAAYRFRFPTFGSGATRAQGRTAGAFAQMALIADDVTAAGYADLVNRRVSGTAAVSSLNVAGPMKVPAWGGPDLRKDVFNPDGTRGPWASMWELGLFMVGMRQAMLCGHKDINAAAIEAVLLKCAETIAQFGFFKQGETWRTVDDILWSNGSAPPGGMVFPSPHIVSNEGARATGTWTFAGVLVARDVLPPKSPLLPLVNEYVAAITGNQEASGTIPNQVLDAADWWAITPAIKR